VPLDNLEEKMGDPLFGSGIRMNGAWANHMSTSADVGFWATARTTPALTRFAIGIAWQADRRALVMASLAALAQAGTGALGVLSVNDVLARLLASGPAADRIRAAVPAILAVGVCAAIGSLARAIAIATEGRLGTKVTHMAEQRLLEHVARAELNVLEDGDFHRVLTGSRLGIRATEDLLMTVLAVIGSLVGLAAMAGVLAILHPLLMPLLILAVIPQAWKAMSTARRWHASTVRSLNATRQKDLLAEVLVESGAKAEEIRVHGLADFLLYHYRRLAVALEVERTRLARDQAGAGVLADAAGGVAKTVTYVALGWLMVTGQVAVAAAGTTAYAITRVTTYLTSSFIQFNGLYRHSLFVADYQRTLRQLAKEAIPVGGRAVAAHPARIELRNVCFTYPGSDRMVLRGVDLEFARGEVIALVGANGSGKSTLARLIAGLHQPQQGTILWDGVDVREADRHQVFSRIAWIGQDFPRWPFTARVNATVGSPRNADDEARLARAAKFTGADELIASLPEGWDTLLAREIQGGTNISGGQWQRLALARGHFRDAQILICDEPTAALDPMTEIETFRKLMDLAGAEQTIVLISHRLGSVRHADRIYVLGSGQIIESGTFDQLMSLGGEFAQMFDAQRHQYAGSAR
jgi:ATP-binding cassette subfamily B protein